MTLHEAMAIPSVFPLHLHTLHGVTSQGLLAKLLPYLVRYPADIHHLDQVAECTAKYNDFRLFASFAV